jgi:DHA1 family bicyclomycin/chloramphenicol resistance-like MFS transporter
LIALRFVQGTAGAAGIVISRAIVRDLYSGPELTKFFSLLMLVNGAAPILSPIIGGQLLLVTSWPGMFIVLGIVGAVMLLAVSLGVPETLPVERRSGSGGETIGSAFRRLVSDRTFMGYACSQGLVMAAMFAYISGSPFVLQNIYGVSPQVFSLLFAINGSGIIIASQVTGRLAGRISESKLLAAGLMFASLGGIALLVMILVGAGLYAVLVPLFLVVASVGIVTTTAFSLAMNNQGQSAGSAAAVLGVLSFLFGAIAAPIAGAAGSGTAVPMGIVIAAANAGAVWCFASLTKRRVKMEPFNKGM